MKKFFFPLFAILMLAVSCKKSSSDGTSTAPPYMSTSAGSTWNYEIINNTNSSTTLYTLASTNRDSTVNGKAYHVYTNTTAGNEYYNITGSDYYTFRYLGVQAGGTTVESIYLKDNSPVGTTWTQSVPVTFSGIPLMINFNNSITEKGIAKTVNSITYNDVIHVTTVITIPGIPSSSLYTDIHSYYGRKVGMIQSKNVIHLNYSGVVQNTDLLTNLKTSTIL